MKHDLLEKYIISRIDNKKYCKTNGQFNRHLTLNNITFQGYYEKYYLKNNPKCPYCGKKHLILNQASLKYSLTCGDESCTRKQLSISHKNRTKEQIEKSNELRKNTNNIIYGGDASRTKEQQQLMVEKIDYFDIAKKAKITKKEKYGDENYNNREKFLETLEGHDIDKKNEINEKRRKTNLDRFGVENVFNREDVMKNVGRFNGVAKEYKLPSGKIIKVTGYEPQALDKLLKYVDEQDIKVGEFFGMTSRKLYSIPVFEYYSQTGILRIYYPDIYIPKDNLIIEVKSRWWYDANGRKGHDDRILNNNKKRDACLLAGYRFQFWICEKDKTWTIIEKI